jgi:hypothetical protein
MAYVWYVFSTSLLPNVASQDEPISGLDSYNAFTLMCLAAWESKKGLLNMWVWDKIYIYIHYI